MGSGQLQSPNYPNNYPNNKDCHWIITAPFGFAIALDFQTFEVKYDCIKEFWGFEALWHYLLYRNIAYEMYKPVNFSIAQFSFAFFKIYLYFF